MARLELTQDEVLQALQDAMAKPSRPEGAFRVVELSEALGLTERSVLKYLHKLQRADRLAAVPITVTRLDGKVQRVMGYKLKASAPVKRAARR